MLPADRAWLVIAVGVTGYEVAAARLGWEFLSAAVARYRRRTLLITDGVIVYLAAHLLGLWPTRFDPLHRLASWIKPRAD